MVFISPPIDSTRHLCTPPLYQDFLPKTLSTFANPPIHPSARNFGEKKLKKKLKKFFFEKKKFYRKKKCHDLLDHFTKKKKKVIVLYILVETCDPYSKIA